tara:strand:- start:37540 stop:37833 length:294 start_codon:yes stop_codon:yes gene_type:complete
MKNDKLNDLKFYKITPGYRILSGIMGLLMTGGIFIFLYDILFKNSDKYEGILFTEEFYVIIIVFLLFIFSSYLFLYISITNKFPRFIKKGLNNRKIK